MSRSLQWTTIVLFLVAFAAPSAAQVPFSFRIAAVGGLHDGEVTATANGTDLGSTSATLYSAGVELDVGTPIGLHVGATFLRHFGDLSGNFDDVPDELTFGLGANEFGVFVEERFHIAPTSPVLPYFGVGAGYGRMSLAQELEWSTFSNSLEGDIDVFRLYGMVGLEALGSLGLKMRVGYLFGSIEGDDLTFGDTIETESGDEVDFEIAYDGFFVSAAVSLFGF